MSSKVRRFLMLPVEALVVMGLVLASGCATNATAGTPTQDQTELSGTITESGSTSVKPLAEKLATAFMEKHPKVRIEIGGGGSSKGVSDCASGISDIGAVSREVKITEQDLIYYPIARDAVAIVVNEACPITDLTIEQVAKIYVGEITKWDELGWVEGGDITVYCREVGSGTLDCFASKVLKEIGGGEEDITPHAERFDSNAGMQLAVQGDESGIGFVSLGYVQGLEVLKLEGVECSIETCLSGEYPVLRRLALVTKACPDDPVKAFIDFCRSSEAQDIAEEAGYVPLVT